MFKKKNMNILLEHCDNDYSINLQESTQLLFGPIYNLSKNKLALLKKCIDKTLVDNFIYYLKSLVRTLIFFVIYIYIHSK